MFPSDEPDPVAEFDQAKAGMRDIARLTWVVYESHFIAGFSQREAFVLAHDWFMMMVRERGPGEHDA